MIRIEWIELKPADGGVLTREPTSLEIPQGSTVPQALGEIGLLAKQIAQLLETRAVAIHGMYATENTVLFEGDRIEILDELQFEMFQEQSSQIRLSTETL